MSRLTDKQDAYGHAMHDYLHGKGGYEIVEREDGLAASSAGPPAYFAAHRNWDPMERKAIRFARDRVLDIGCGAGRVALYLQEKGHEVLGIDVSPLAVRVCRERGVKRAKVMSITQVSRRLGVFDTIVMFGNNFGLFGTFNRARWLLRRFRGMTTDHGRIIAQSNDPYQTDQPHHLAYQRQNKRRGRMGGQLRIRTRYLTYATPWFDYLLVARDEMRAILDGTGWHVAQFVDSGGSVYVAVIEKDVQE